MQCRMDAVGSLTDHQTRHARLFPENYIQGVAMNILGRFSVLTKRAIALVLSALALVASIGAAASLIHQRLIADRLDALTAMVQSAKSLEAKLEAHDLTRDQALAQMRKAVQARRFDHGASYMAQ